MEFTIVNQDDAARKVTVVFKEGDVTHTRDVNGCYSAEGVFDLATTTDRIKAVGLGVSSKIALGVIVSDPIPQVDGVVDVSSVEEASTTTSEVVVDTPESEAPIDNTEGAAVPIEEVQPSDQVESTPEVPEETPIPVIKKTRKKKT